MKLPRLTLYWVCICSTILLGATSLADKPAKPPAAKELVGVYVGYSNSDDFYRLDLRPDFTGWFAQVAPPTSILHEYGVHTYRVAEWRLDRFDLSFKLVPVDSQAEGIHLKGSVGAFDVLRLEASGTTNRWERKLVLHADDQTRASNEETKEAIKRAEGK